MPDRKTLDVYRERADDYQKCFASAEADQGIRDFLDALAPASRLLDLGCGPGQALRHMVQTGHNAEGIDPVPEFVELAQSVSGAPVTLGTFDTLTAEGEYDGIFANFSLLHAPKADMPIHLASIARALNPGGIFHIALKTGQGEKRDKIGRFYAYYTEPELRGLLNAAGFQVLQERNGADPGLDGTVAPWVIMLARKSQ